jgi:hypothetical protein
MQQQERDLIADLFGRLQQYESQQRDAEAERLIASSVARQPASPYLLVQTALVQEEALKQARARIAELESKASSQASGQGSFLGNAPRPAGPWGSAPAQQQPAPAQASPWGQTPQALAGGSFLRSALATAAGVAGGALLFEGIRNMFGHSTQAFASPLSDVQPLSDMQPLPDNSPLMPPDQLSSADLAQDDGAADDYDTSDDSSDDSGFDSSSDDI